MCCETRERPTDGKIKIVARRERTTQVEEKLPPGRNNKWTVVWRTLNRLRAGVGRTRENQKERGNNRREVQTRRSADNGAPTNLRRLRNRMRDSTLKVCKQPGAVEMKIARQYENVDYTRCLCYRRLR